MPASEARRQLDFTGVLAALQERLGTSVKVSCAGTDFGWPVATLVGELIQGNDPGEGAPGFLVGDSARRGVSGWFAIDPDVLSGASEADGVLEVQLGVVRLVISKGPALEDA